MTDHVLFCDAQLLRHDVLRGLRILHGCPRGQFAVAKIRQSDHRLHRSMGKQRNIIVSLHDFAALSKNAVHVTFAANDLGRFVGRLLQLLLILRGIVGFVRPVVPDHFEFLAPLKGRPSVVGDHGDAAERLEGRRRLEWINGNRLTNSAYFQRLFIVIRLHLAA